MKKMFIYLIPLTMVVTVAEARDVSVGSLMVTGDTNLESSSNKSDFSGGSITTDSTDINLAGAYFVTTNLGVGLMLSKEDTKTNDGTTIFKESMMMVGPIVGYNISLNSDSSILLNASIFSVSGDMNDGAGYDADIDGNGYMMGGSFNYFLNEHVALNLGVRWVKADLDYSYGGTTVATKMTETGTTIGLMTFF